MIKFLKIINNNLVNKLNSRLDIAKGKIKGLAGLTQKTAQMREKNRVLEKRE